MAFWTPLIVARLQEAELQISGLVQPPGIVAGELDHQLKAWAFHR